MINTIVPFKKALEMSEEEWHQLHEEVKRLDAESLEHKAFEQFIRKPEESNLYDKKFLSNAHFLLLFFLFCMICVCSIISCTKGWIVPFVAIPIAFFSMIGIVILAIDAKKNGEKKQ